MKLFCIFLLLLCTAAMAQSQGEAAPEAKDTQTYDAQNAKFIQGCTDIGGKVIKPTPTSEYSQYPVMCAPDKDGE